MEDFAVEQVLESVIIGADSYGGAAGDADQARRRSRRFPDVLGLRIGHVQICIFSAPGEVGGQQRCVQEIFAGGLLSALLAKDDVSAGPIASVEPDITAAGDGGGEPVIMARAAADEDDRAASGAKFAVWRQGLAVSLAASARSRARQDSCSN